MIYWSVITSLKIRREFQNHTFGSIILTFYLLRGFLQTSLFAWAIFSCNHHTLQVQGVFLLVPPKTQTMTEFLTTGKKFLPIFYVLGGTTVFVFALGPCLSMWVICFCFYGNYNGKTAKNLFTAIKSSKNVLQPSSYHCWPTKCNNLAACQI